MNLNNSDGEMRRSWTRSKGGTDDCDDYDEEKVIKRR